MSIERGAAAPRSMLMLSGDRDAGAPLAGVEILEERLARVYTLHEAPNRFRSIVYTNTGHEYLPEMQTAVCISGKYSCPVFVYTMLRKRFGASCNV